MYQKCPVCEGRGIVPPGFYNLDASSTTTANSAETCRSCQGSGVIYNPDYAYPWIYEKSWNYERPWWDPIVYTTKNDSTNLF